jgi:glycosyltransferase involved in cell wall biosynthesis
VGGFDHAPNSDGLLWFVRECWPRILSKVPQAKFTVVGSNPTEEILALGAISRISVAGHVPETAPYLDRAAVSVAPLRYGGGVKGKVCEALASGMPLVTTTTGSQGLAIRDYREARVQDEAIPFADAVVWALTHTEAAEAMGVEGRRIVEGICGVEVTSKQVQDIFEVYSQLPTRAEKVKWLFHWLSFKSGARSMKRFFIEEMKARRCLRDARTSV